ncbi:MAG: J domain-containing protein [Bryobacterales bacterium]|nr:J domain-containing protein [Bryobacterales bacterium]
MTSTPTQEFTDLYELLQVSPNAELDTIQRVFRLLAQRYHPDNTETGNEPLFQQMLKAYQTLSDPVSRAAYDAQHRAQVKLNWKVFDQSTEHSSQHDERKKREGLLAVLYRKRQFNPNVPGMNLREIEDLIGIPREHLEFTVWFLKERGDIKVGDNGRYMISIKGVEAYENMSMPAAQEKKGLVMLPAAEEEQTA